jgi:hypothetical protein
LLPFLLCSIAYSVALASSLYSKPHANKAIQSLARFQSLPRFAALNASFSPRKISARLINEAAWFWGVTPSELGEPPKKQSQTARSKPEICVALDITLALLKSTSTDIAKHA